MKMTVFVPGVLGTAILAFHCAVSVAADPVSYQITATHKTHAGTTLPFLDKELSFQVSYRAGSRFSVSQHPTANTNSNGQATLTVNPTHLEFRYAGIELFCAKLDGPHYCNGVFATENNPLNPTDDVSQVLYDCTYSVQMPQDSNPGVISVTCTDK